MNWTAKALKALLTSNEQIVAREIPGTAVRANAQKAKKDWTPLLLEQIKLLSLPEPVLEYEFHPTRRWRFDLAWPSPELHVACEIEGGVWTGGRHVRGQGFIEDCHKYNEAAILNWRLVRVTPDMIKDGTAVDQLQRLITAVLEIQ